MKIFNRRSNSMSISAVVVVLASWITPYPVRCEQAGRSPHGENSFELTQPGAALPAICCNQHRHSLLTGATPVDDTRPWTAADIVSAEDLSKSISSTHGPKPVIFQVGIEALYRDAHIPEAIFAGPASEPEGLALLKSKAKAIARNKEILIYCGCCPWKDCPNILPAFVALQQLGFKKVRLLNIPTDFQQDWVNKGFPTVRG